MTLWFRRLTPTGLPVADVRRFLRDVGRPDTLRHVSRVAAVGCRLARRFGVPLAQTDLACTAHDLAAVVPLRDIVAAEMLRVPLSEADRAIPQVVHGPVAAAVLRVRLRICVLFISIGPCVRGRGWGGGCTRIYWQRILRCKRGGAFHFGGRPNPPPPSLMNFDEQNL